MIGPVLSVLLTQSHLILPLHRVDSVTIPFLGEGVEAERCQAPVFQATQLVSSRASIQTRWSCSLGPALNCHPRLSFHEFLREGLGHSISQLPDMESELPSWSVHCHAMETNLVSKVLEVQLGGVRDRERPWRG